MADEPVDARLSRINTLWSLVNQANQAGSDRDAQGRLLERYGGAVYRYLLGAVRDTSVADELFQEFALRFLQGKFHAVAPDKGRFRDYVKAVLFNLVSLHHKQKNRLPFQAESQVLASAADTPEDQADLDFNHSWRDELLARTWEALAELQKQTGSLYFTMLDYRTRHPQSDSAEMAVQLSRDLNKPLTAAGVRQTIHRARDKFADLLLEEVSRSLQTESVDDVEQEVIDLGLHSYCADAIKRRREAK